MEETFSFSLTDLSFDDSLFTHLAYSAGFLSARLTSFDAAGQVPDEADEIALI